MSTRYLTIVINEDKPVIAQYGHFDGDPITNGLKILNLLRKDKEQYIRTQLHRCTFIEENEYRSFFKMHFLDEEALSETHPKFWWYDGADLLEMLLERNGTAECRMSYDFAYDSIQCEWAYVIDYDKQTFEVYKGWSKTPISGSERFYNEGKSENGFYPVRLVAKYSLETLPSPEVFVKTAWRDFEDMDIKVKSITTHNGINQSEFRALYENMEDFIGYIPKIIIGERMYLMHPDRKRSRIHTTKVKGHTRDGNLHIVKTRNSIYTFEEMEKESNDLCDVGHTRQSDEV